MGVVYRARDMQTTGLVAVKIAHGHGRASLERFERESRTLAQLHHPAIVGYLDHGMTDDGRLYLAMEWLEGEDLRQRLDREALPLSEALSMIGRVAEALAEAHVNGIVHRDVKPGNLFLVDNDPARVKVLDFGAAHLMDNAQPLTRTGSVLGTAGYIAPEQIRDPRHVDPRADVFALGCVLYECITGSAPFVGAHPLALIAKLLVDDVPRVAQVRPEIPEPVDALAARMMAKDPAERLPNAHAVRAELEGLGSLEAPAPVPGDRPAFMTSNERRLVTALLVDVRGPSDAPEAPDVTATDCQRVMEMAGRFRGQPVALGSGTVLVLFGRGMAADDQAAHAATCALALANDVPGASIALATGQAATTANMPVGPAIDAAAALIASVKEPGVRLDTLTEGLLQARFHVEGGWLLAPTQGAASARTLLGKPSPMVGRRKELALLTAVLDACVEEGEAHAVLLAGEPGMGKTRLAEELCAHVRSRPAITILRARGSILGAGSSLALARQLVVEAVPMGNLGHGATWERALRDHVASLPDLDAPDRVGDFLCELVAPGAAGGLTPKLHAARNDARIMGEWLERSFVEWLGALGGHQSLLLVLEDIHWGDAASLAYLGRALRELPTRPIMVLALARPEVHDKFPGLWKDTGLQEVRLTGLSRRAAEELVRSALGDEISAERMAVIVQRAAGNAFFLEELIRCAALQGVDDPIPDTVVAMVQSRLDALEPNARRVLCAASIFGEAFPLQGVEALLEAGSTLHDAAGWLRVLERRELLSALDGGHTEAPSMYTFRHELVREAVYASMSDTDRRTGHRLAARWLEEAGEREPKVLIEHLERGDLEEETVPWLLQAAQRAFYAGQLVEAVALAERGLGRGAADRLRGELLVCRGLARGWLQDYAGALESGEECLSLVPEGSNAWYLTAGGLIFSAALSGRPDVAVTVLPRLVTAPRPDTATGPYGFAMMLVMFGAVSMAQRDLAASTVHGLEAALAGDGDDAFRGWVHQIRGMHRLWVDDDPRAAARDFHDASTHFASAGEVTGPELAASLSALARWHLGEVDNAERACRDGLASFRAPAALDNFAITLAYILRGRGELDALEALMRPRLASPDATIVGYGHMLLAESRRCGGDLSEAETLARQGLDVAAWTLTIQPGLQQVLAHTLLDAGRADEALQHAEEGLRVASTAGAFPVMRSELLVVRALALHRLGRQEEARAGVEQAVARLAAMGEGLTAQQREAMLALPPHLRTMDLARRWKG
jgi:eukaryotic-like serine/threonine-protein kinase